VNFPAVLHALIYDNSCPHNPGVVLGEQAML
jgi:hypothetical protein